MLISAHTLGLETLWLSLFEKEDVRELFGFEEDKVLFSIVCLGYPEFIPQAPPRKGLETKVRYIK